MENTIPIHQRIGHLERAFLTIIIIVGVFMAILDTTIVEVIVPKIMAPLSTDLYGVQWVITAYMMAAATGLLVVEALANSFGLKWIFILGLALFTGASFACGHSGNLGEMIFFRSIQGCGEAFLVATAETMLFTIYPPEKRGLAMGIYALAVSFAPSLGPTIGGYITDRLTWHFVFFINVPIGIANIIAAIFFIPKLMTQKERFRINISSFLLISLATISLLTLLSKGQQHGWFQSTFIVKLAISAAVGYLLFGVSEIISKEPLVDFKIFRISEFQTAFSIYFVVLGLSMYQVFYLLPLYYEHLRFLSTFKTGLHLLPLATMVGLFSIISGAMSDKIGPEKVLVASGIVLSAGAYLFLPHLNYYTPKLKSCLLTIPYGIGMGMFFAPVTTLALKELGEKTNLGVSLMHYIRFVGGSFGTALATNSLERNIVHHYDEICALQGRNLSYIQSYVHHWYSLVSPYMSPDVAMKKAKALLGFDIQVQALSHAFQSTFMESSIYAFLGLVILALFFAEKRRRRLAAKGHMAVEEG
jgi:DHA2 family multidrug resistance protein